MCKSTWTQGPLLLPHIVANQSLVNSSLTKPRATMSLVSSPLNETVSYSRQLVMPKIILQKAYQAIICHNVNLNMSADGLSLLIINQTSVK